MKKYFFITVLFLLVTRIIAGEIPNDFLKSDDQEWQAYLKRSLVFPEPSITLESFVQCLKIPHVFERWDDPISPKTKKKILLSATKLLPREALWELKQQTGCEIEIDVRCYGTLNILFGKKN